MSQNTNEQNRNAQERKSQPDKSKKNRSILIWLVLFLFFLMAAQFLPRQNDNILTVSYTEFQEFLVNNNIEEVFITDKLITGRLRQNTSIVAEGMSQNVREFKVYIPFDDPDLISSLLDKNVVIIFL